MNRSKLHELRAVLPVVVAPPHLIAIADVPMCPGQLGTGANPTKGQATMAHNAELMKAIGSHGQWKMKLRTAIGCGKLDSPIETIRNADACEFGNWVRTFKASDPSDAEFLPKIRTLHAEFHKSAARVAELALQGKQADAEAQLQDGGSFTKASTQLTEAIMDWKSR